MDRPVEGGEVTYSSRAKYAALLAVYDLDQKRLSFFDSETIYDARLRGALDIAKAVISENPSADRFSFFERFAGGEAAFKRLLSDIRNAACQEAGSQSEEDLFIPAVRAAVVIRSEAHQRRLLALIAQLAEAVRKGDFAAVDCIKGELDSLCENREGKSETYGMTLAELRAIATEPVWLIKGIIGETACGFIGALEKMGKTWLALYLAVCVSLGRDFIGRTTLKRRVLYIAAEGGKAFLVWRLDCICNGLGINPNDLDIVIQPEAIQIDTPEGLQWLRQAIRRHGIGLVIIDPLTRCHSKKENDSDQVEPINSALRAIANKSNCAFVVLHHASKAGGRGHDDFDPLRGSGAFKGFADFVLGLKPVAKPGTGIRFELTSILRDAPALERMIYDISISEAARSFEISWASPESEPTRADASLRILEALSKEVDGMNTRTIGERTKLNGSQLSPKLRDLEKSGRIEKKQQGRALIWRIKKQETLYNEEY
jgi:DNA-binding transcriptional ArsR family regulator